MRVRLLDMCAGVCVYGLGSQAINPVRVHASTSARMYPCAHMPVVPVQPTRPAQWWSSAVQPRRRRRVGHQSRWPGPQRGEVAALTDALIIVRHLFGFTGSAMIDRAIATGAVNNTPELVSGRLSELEAAMDVDRNGQVDALTDGLLIMRFAFGFRGDVLIRNAIGSGATRATAQQVENYLSGLVN